ncbi:MAG: rane protein of unknown function [Acidobacteria bacterium]|nr:rane protein of unknown function [Acidobacteriota bacterium]
MTHRPPRGVRRFIVGLLAVFVAKQIVIACISPPFTGHDEVAHFQGIRILATERRIPTLWADTLPGDLYQYRPYSIEWRGRDDSPLYTAVHPPLYYLLMAPVYRAVSGASPETIQYVLRCASIPFGAATVLIAWMLTTTLFPRDAFLAVTVPTVVAFQPQVSYEAAMVNNDALAIAMYSTILYLLVLALRDGATLRRAIVLGLLAGTTLLAKGTTVMSLALIPAVLWTGRRGGSRTVVTQTAAALAVAAVIIGPWWWFMIRTYGDPMAFGAIAATQPDLTRQDATFLQLLFSGRFMVDRWIESWGEFGWRLVHIGGGLTAALFVAGTVCAAGLLLVAVSGNRDRSPERRWRMEALAVLAAACALSYLATAQFGVRFVLTQARYFFPMVDAAALLLMLGLRAWIPSRWRDVGQAVVVFLAIAVNVTIYTSYVIPYWYFR